MQCDEVTAHHVALKRYLRSCGLPPHDAEDISQQACLRLLESTQDAHPRHARALLFHIARNLVVDLRRSAHHRLVTLTGNDEELDRAVLLDPERQLSARENLQGLLSAVDELPPRRRQAFLLRRVEGASLKAISRAMKIGVPAVENHLTLALRSLRKAGFC